MLNGRAAEYERDLPFGVFIDALDRHLASLDSQVALLGERMTAELAAVFPSLERFVTGPVRILEGERYRLHQAVRSLLERLASERALVLALDDLHWADAASCELIAALIRRAPEVPVLIALAYRTGRAPGVVASALATHAPGLTVERVLLSPLSRAESLELIGTGVRSAAVRELLCQDSGGNPFFLQQLVRFGRSGEELRSRDRGEAWTMELPAAIAEALAAEVRALSSRGRSVVEAAAVAGEPFEPDVVAAVADVDEADVVDALDELLGCDLIRETSVPRRFRFRHPLVRHAVYSGIGGGSRLAAHMRAAIVLNRRGDGPMACAPHVERSAALGDEHAIELLAAAGAGAAGRAPASSARWWLAALRLVPEHGPLSARRGQILPTVAATLASAGRIDESHALWLQALEEIPPLDVAARVGVIAACAGIERMLGRHEQALRRLLAAREGEVPRTREAVLVELELAAYGGGMNEPELMCDSARRALTGAQVIGDPMLEMAGATTLSTALFYQGRIEEADAAYQQAAQLLSILDESQIALYLDCVYYLAVTAWMMGRYLESEEQSSQAIAWSQVTGRTQLLIEMMSTRSWALSVLGRLDEALVLADDCLEAAQVNANANTVIYAESARCLALSGLGRADDALEAGERALTSAGAVAVSVLTGMAAITYAAALISFGHPERGIDVLLEWLGGPGLPRWFVGGRPPVYALLTHAELALGNQEHAEGWARRAETIAVDLDLPMIHASATRARAAVLLGQGDAARAATLAGRSAAYADTCGARLLAAEARLLAGRAHTLAGDRDAAAQELRRAETEFLACGAQRLREETVRHLRRIGRRVHRAVQRGTPGGRGVAALSGREREVAGLVCQHRTNREIATRLFLSEKTVESHLRAIFAKLGVDSRAQAARQLSGIE